MKTVGQLREILEGAHRLDSHVHTHLCDGKPEMTMESIAARAREIGLDTVILTPHFHKQVRDESETLYTDTDESIFFALREEINHYEKQCGAVRFLLSAEVDILSEKGDLSLKLSLKGEEQLDLVTPTMNYHPLLPLRFVHLTYGKDVDRLHESGEYQDAARAIGGVERVLESMYQTQINAILHCPYPAMLGHFFAAHSVHPQKYTWFNAKKEHLPLMKEGAMGVIEACRKTKSIMDLTGVHLQKGESVAERWQKNDFLTELQATVLSHCKREKILALAGSDAHRLEAIGRSEAYYRFLLNRV